MVETRPVAVVCLVWVVLVVLVLFSTIRLFFLPSTMTWAPCPHGVRTRGKKFDTVLLKRSKLQIIISISSRKKEADRAFHQSCYVLKEVVAPGRIQYSRRVFAECCSLFRVGTGRDTEATDDLAPGAAGFLRLRVALCFSRSIS